MERVGSISQSQAAQIAGRTIPVGRGWVMEPLETGFLLKALAQGAQLRISPDEAQSLRDGQTTPEALAARHGLAHPPHPAGAAVTVAFSDEARRLAGTPNPAGGTATATGSTKDRPANGIPLPSPLTTAAILAALAILALALAI
jgi:hypothetical protein